MEPRRTAAPEPYLRAVRAVRAALAGSALASLGWVVALLGLTWGPPVLAFVGAALVLGGVALVASRTGRAGPVLGLTLVVPALVLLVLSRV